MIQWMGVILIFIAIIGSNISSEKDDIELSNDLQEKIMAKVLYNGGIYIKYKKFTNEYNCYIICI